MLMPDHSPHAVGSIGFRTGPLGTTPSWFDKLTKRSSEIQ
jgi:hypothetical protein